MSHRQIGLTWLVVVITAAAVVLSGVVVLQALYAGLAAASAGDMMRARMTMLSALLALGVIAIALAFVAGRALTRALTQLRAAVLARARGDTGTPLPSSGVAALSGLASAIERLSARDAAREADAKRESAEVSVLLDTISEGILRLDDEGRVLRANPAARALLGLGSAPVGRPITAHVRSAELRRLLERAAAGVAVSAAEITLDERRLIVSARPVHSATDDRGGAVVAVVDLTEVRRLESVRRDFVANVSHELKTPLTAIAGYVETLLGDDELPPDMHRQFLEVVRKNADRLHHIVEDLLDLSRLESGGWRPELQPFEAGSLIDEVWSGCSAQAHARGVTFTNAAVPQPGWADPAGLRQVLSNLFDNALRHTPPGGRIEVMTELVAPESGGNGRAGGEQRSLIVFEVRDTGSGIPTDALPRIFERFYRVDPARSRADGGTGLGLSIVRHLIESMGGDVSARSELGKGTVIRFRLPAA